MAFFPANSSYPGILGELYSAAFTAPAFNWLCSPAVTELETVVLDWVAKALGLPNAFLSEREGGGVIQGSASEAIVTVIVAARERLLRRTAEREGLKDGSKEWEVRTDELRGGKLVALGSEQAHSSTQKAAIIAGTKFRTVPAHCEDNFAMRGKELRRVLQECRDNDLTPFYLTVTLGTTSTCAVDDFNEIADVLKDWPDIWVHVDAAYAGAALICAEYQHLASRFDAFDSFDFNMHKWLLTNFDASCLFIRKRSDLTTALSITPSYLRNTYSDSGLVTDYRDWQIPLGRRFRSLKIWFVIRSYGISGLQQHIRGHIKLGELFHSLVLTRPDLFSVLAGPTFALTVITVVPKKLARRRRTSANEPDPSHERYLNDFTPDAQAQALMDANHVTKEVYEAVNNKGEIFLTSSIISGIYAIRVVSASPTAEEKYVRRAFEILVKTAEEVLT
jgi:aromatic-L-amino-acid/L-tryptophan decarboxylase